MGRKKIRYDPNWEAPITFRFLRNFDNLKNLSAYEKRSWAGLCRSTYDDFRLKRIRIYVDLSKIETIPYLLNVITHEYLHAAIRHLIPLPRKDSKPDNLPFEEQVVSYLAEEIKSPFTKRYTIPKSAERVLEAMLKAGIAFVEWMNHESKVQKV